MHEIFHGAQRPAVQHFTRSGCDAAARDFDDGFRGVVHGLENGEQRFDGLRLAHQPYRDFSDDGQRSFGADEQASEIVAGGLGGFSADANDAAIGQDEFESGDVIRGDAVGQRVRAARVFRDVAADRAGLLARWIGREVQAEMLDGAREIEIHHAGLHHRAIIFRVHFENAVHPRKCDDDSALARERAAGKSGARASADDRRFIFIRKADNVGNVGGRRAGRRRIPGAPLPPSRRIRREANPRGGRELIRGQAGVRALG